MNALALKKAILENYKEEHYLHEVSGGLAKIVVLAPDDAEYEFVENIPNLDRKADLLHILKKGAETGNSTLTKMCLELSRLQNDSLDKKGLQEAHDTSKNRMEYDKITGGTFLVMGANADPEERYGKICEMIKREMAHQLTKKAESLKDIEL
jgi:hypothetical protein